YNFYIPANRIREFLWNLFAAHYIEMAKARAYAGDTGALCTLHTCLKTVCELLAPINPFITDKIYREVYGQTVHKKQMPAPNEHWDSEALGGLTQKLVEFNSMVWKTKKDKSISLNAEIEGIKMPTELKPLEDDLKKMHKLI
ncbi:MAG: class I tRNA ligase family protein, partial [Candidatus Micrarchaeota archaeon]